MVKLSDKLVISRVHGPSWFSDTWADLVWQFRGPSWSYAWAQLTLNQRDMQPLPSHQANFRHRHLWCRVYVDTVLADPVCACGPPLAALYRVKINLYPRSLHPSVNSSASAPIELCAQIVQRSRRSRRQIDKRATTSSHVVQMTDNCRLSESSWLLTVKCTLGAICPVA
jgi:hypothetical protein